MFVKQISTEEALRLANKGWEVLVMVPRFVDDENEWTDYDTYTLVEILNRFLFFRKEPAMEEQIQNIPEAPKNRPPDVWIPAKLTEKEAGTAER